MKHLYLVACVAWLVPVAACGSGSGAFGGNEATSGTSSAASGSGSGAGSGGASAAAQTGATAGTATTSSASTGGFDPLKDPTAKINHPGDGEMRKINTDIPFIGVANDPQDGMLSGASLVWTSDKEGKLGIGATFNKQLKVVGKQVITLTATDSDGNKGIATITLNMTP